VASSYYIFGLILTPAADVSLKLQVAAMCVLIPGVSMRPQM
jgi:hypothetical protein